MPQFFFFDLLLISSMSSPGALADYHSLHLLSGSKGSGKEMGGSGRGRTQGEVLGRGGSAELLAFTAPGWDAAGCRVLRDSAACRVLRDAVGRAVLGCRVLWNAAGPSCIGMQGAAGCCRVLQDAAGFRVLRDAVGPSCI